MPYYDFTFQLDDINQLFAAPELDLFSSTGR